uniref:PP28 domain-containing protein n=1 Tax=Mesocestoides corti TaxID=53468 RepID=A0A5K3FB57_MESCO
MFSSPEELMLQAQRAAEEVDRVVESRISEEDSEDSEEEEEEGEVKPCGVSHLIETSNPNRTGKPPNRDDAPLSRKEREALLLATTDPLKLKSEAELERDLARLRMVRRKREREERKKEEEKKAAEAARAAAQARAQERLEALKNKNKKTGRKPGAKVGKNAASQPSSAPPPHSLIVTFITLAF